MCDKFFVFFKPLKFLIHSANLSVGLDIQSHKLASFVAIEPKETSDYKVLTNFSSINKVYLKLVALVGLK